MAETSYDSDSLRDAASNLGGILDDMAPFNDLKAHWPNAGKFELAQWLERIVDDRRNAVVAHAEHLRMAFDSMNRTLTQIADDFSSTDGDNAAKIKDTLDDLEGSVEGEWDEWDKNTEDDQKNYASDGNEANAQDGDGYNDNLNVPVGEVDSGSAEPPDDSGGDDSGGDDSDDAQDVADINEYDDEDDDNDDDDPSQTTGTDPRVT